MSSDYLLTINTNNAKMAPSFLQAIVSCPFKNLALSKRYDSIARNCPKVSGIYLL